MRDVRAPVDVRQMVQVFVTVRGDLALIVMAGLVVVRRTMWVTPSSSWMAKVVSETGMPPVALRRK